MLDRRLIDLAAGVLRVPADELSPDTALGSLESWDSLGHLQLVVTVEAAYGVRFSTERILQLTSLRAIQEELARP